MVRREGSHEVNIVTRLACEAFQGHRGFQGSWAWRIVSIGIRGFVGVEGIGVKGIGVGNFYNFSMHT
jgi:hypothetical protein